MNTFIIIFATILSFCTNAVADVKVVTSIPALSAIAQEIVADRTTVTSLASPKRDPHFVDGKPSLMLALNRADLLIHVGLGLESGWLPPLVTGSRNPKIQPGQKGNLDGSSAVGPLLETNTVADRSLGDVHPGGNPHYWLDPHRVQLLASAIAERLKQLDPANGSIYEANLASFSTKLREATEKWETKLAPYKGRSVVPFHKSLTYLEHWLGLNELATIEPLPGIEPSPSHLAELIITMRNSTSPVVVLTEPWYRVSTAQTVAEKAGARFIQLPGDVGSVSGVENYIQQMNLIIARLLLGFNSTEQDPISPN